MHYKWLERRFLVSLWCLRVMRAAEPSQVIKDNQWKMWGSVVLCIPNPTYNRNSAQNYYLNSTFFQSAGEGQDSLFAGVAVLPKPKKQKNSVMRIDTDQNTLETLKRLLCFTSSDRFLSAMFTFSCIKWQSQPASSPKVGYFTTEYL